ncbi:MAG: dihydroneopterin aldolase [Verrucomicrobiota bacterium]
MKEDLIKIEGQEVWCHIGVPDEERAEKQRLEISVEFPVGNAREAARLDCLTKSVDYFSVSESIKKIASEKPRKLIETLAEEMAVKLRKEFSLNGIEVEVRKFILKGTKWVSIKIQRP